MKTTAAFVAAQPGTIDHSECVTPGCDALNESLVWYYDGDRVFRQISRYRKDPSWLGAAQKCRLYYRSYLNCPAVGHYVDGWRNFTKGLYYDWVDDQNATSKHDAVLMAKRGKFSQSQHKADLPGWLTTPSVVDASREIAYAISAWGIAKKLGVEEFAGRDPYLDLAYYQLDTWKIYLQGYPESKYPGEQGAQYQPFMFALTCEALIDVYTMPNTLQADREKILIKIRDVAKLTYDKLYRDANHSFVANTGHPTTYWPALNLLIVPLYGWLWHETGDQYYLDSGDKIFSDGVVFGWPEAWGGKQFSQNYRWSFDYVSWRQQAPVAADVFQKRHAVSKEHPRLLGSRQELQALAKQRRQEYERVKTVASSSDTDDHAKMISMALVCAVEKDGDLGRQAIDMALKYVNGPIREGHYPFGAEMARCAIVYDLCHEYWTQQERDNFCEYMNKTVDANVESETHVFHNGWYGYKNWGYGLACYATFYENPRAPQILKTLEDDYRQRAAPALEMAGAGGGWAEGYYINYWLYEWLFFCEVARHCEGIDYYALAPRFYQNRAVASMFETYPGIRIYNSRRSIPMGDGGGRVFGGDRDKVVSARRILVNYYRNDPDHQAVHTFNEMTPRSSVGSYAYKDLLWHDATVKKGDLDRFRLSTLSSGAGYVYARSSWDDAATTFFFKCGDRFTAHQHLDVGHFLIYKDEELAGDGGHYDDFGSRHDVNYHLRTIAHNTILIRDPSEQWLGATSYNAGIRSGPVTGNDGGQLHSWPNHNGAVADPAAWLDRRKVYDIADILAFQDTGSYVYVAGDCTKAYSPKKCNKFIRQIVFIRPGTFIIFDQVESINPQFTKTWLLHTMKVPTGKPPNLVVTNGKGRLFIQTLLPQQPEVKFFSGSDLYAYDGQTFRPTRDTGPAPECRVEISPSTPAKQDIFLHVLTAANSSLDSVPKPSAQVTAKEITVAIDKTRISFNHNGMGGSITIGNQTTRLTERSIP